ncbi:hypothetical protein AAEX63_02580 [Luteococcus sp. H138]|uniref:hypothetical protein n=1 Tax=unclassified Luteococcus TaxID=2639923 RepID=UPI00313CAF3F
MADWTDGAQYAPVERPEGFATPRVAALTVEEPPPNPADGQPTEPPTAFQEPTVVPLESLAPRQEDPRDPYSPFDTVVAADSAWGAVHAGGRWNPRMPLGPAAQPDAGSPAFPPPSGAPQQADFGHAQVPEAVPPTTAHARMTAVPTPGQFPPPAGQPVPLPPPVGAAHGQATHQAPPQQLRPEQHVPQRPANPFDPAPRPGTPQAPQQLPMQQQFGPQPPAQRPLPTQLNAQTVVSETGPLTLAVLAFGALVPGLSYLMLLAGSILTRRTDAGGVLLRSLFNLALWAMLLTVLYDAMVYQDWTLHMMPLGRMLCLLMIPASLACSYNHLRKRMQR